MEDNGFIKIHRQLLNSDIWMIKPFSDGQAWIDLLMLTNHSVGFITVKNGKKIKIIRGQCGYSVVALADRWGWSRGKVQRYINFLENDLKMIQQKIVENHSVININKYDNYQDKTTNDTTNRTTNVQQTDTNKNDKNDKNDKKHLFDIFWLDYPNKKSKSDAYNKFEKVLKSGISFEVIKTGLKNYNKHIKNTKIEKQFIKHPTTWLNQGCWDDVYEDIKEIDDITSSGVKFMNELMEV